MENLVSILLERELKPSINSERSINLLSSCLEDAFLRNFRQDKPIDLLGSTENVLSTIAIALSPDSQTLASTHGDHTVKIFNLSTCELKRNFSGHPRTPWTVKYNPQDCNIVASGCLGFEVRVWDIALGQCLNLLRLDSCIITLAFHPSGDFIMISSGPNLHTWDWREGVPVRYGGYPEGSSPHRPRKIITHTRNVRAVIFHPSGDFVFCAAPDSTKAKRKDVENRAAASNRLVIFCGICNNFVVSSPLTHVVCLLLLQIVRVRV